MSDDRDKRALKLFHRYLGGRWGALEAMVIGRQQRELMNRIEATIDTYIEEEAESTSRRIVEDALKKGSPKVLARMAAAVFSGDE
jgi:hypothetical protein